MSKVKSKVGIDYGLPSHGNSIENISNGDFVATCDGLTFGVLGGKAFNTSILPNWTKEQQTRWAKANAYLFETLSKKLTRYADVVEKEGNVL